ncbi:MAG: dienelactone hydrolase family protein [Bacteroidales bacterium]|nr:dienelactone hydrolase family protein [Bacteroidales bacterium]
MLKHRAISIILIFWALATVAQDKIAFKASDNLDVVAHLYEIDPSYPYIILLHQENYSKGEFKEIAISLLKLKYNCLAVDLRYGEIVNSIPNETALNAKEANVLRSMYDAQIDIEAAINYAYNVSNQEVILLGSSFSGTLAIKIAKDNPKVKAVIAYSPGEFFRNKFLIHDEMEGFDKPLYIAGSQLEYPYLTRLTELVAKDKIIVFQPQNSGGKHGAKALWKSDDVSKEYWLSLLMFINNLR